MKYEVMKKWVAALRSGRYKQGRGALQSSDSFCCLGVLCHLASEEGVQVHKSDEGIIKGSQLGAQASVKDWAQIADCHSCFTSFANGNTSLTYLNDVGFSFQEISDEIEKYWEIL